MNVKLFLTSLTVTLACETITAENKFVTIKNKQNFVDKTLLVKEIVKHKILFINSPRGFGKSTNLDMINLFLSNHRKKSDISKHFEGTKIIDDEEFVKLHLGEHPVVQCTLLANGGKTEFDLLLTSFKLSLHKAFTDHTYLLQSDTILEETKTLMKRYTDLSQDLFKQLNAKEVTDGLSFLLQLLNKHHNKPVVLLIDEFGRGVTEKILQRSTDVALFLDFYTTILEAIFNNSNLISFTVLSGETWLYGLKGSSSSLIERAGFLQNSEISPFYGFTTDEAVHLMNKFKIQENQKGELYKWCGGYSSFDGKVQVFNPTTLLKFLQDKSIKRYCKGSQLGIELIEFMFKELTYKNIFSILLLNSSSSVRINLERDLRLVCLENLRNKMNQIPQHCGNLFFRVLLETGFLSFDENQGNDLKNVTLSMPNEDVRSCFRHYISKFGVVEWENKGSHNLSQILSTN